jgi:hypothetical protein
VRESEIDGDAATLFLFQSVGVDPGESLDQSSFAVVDVARRSYNDRFHL